jgi:tetratricopeptide (TPR) repeat protein
MRPLWHYLQNPDKERPWNLMHDRAMQLAVVLLLVTMAAQGAFWWHARQIMPRLEIVPAVPGQNTLQALSFGDPQALYRLSALKMQNAGDSYGRFTALYKYDYNKLYLWFHLLDQLDPRSSHLAALASYYYSQSQNPNNLRYMVDYLEEHTRDPAVWREKWWWITQAVYLANHKMGDTARALTLAKRLEGVKGIPMWAQQLPAFIHEKRGEYDAALEIIRDVLQDTSQYSEGELNFMKYFIAERLGKMEQIEAEFKRVEVQKTKEIKEGKPMATIEGPPSLE